MLKPATIEMAKGKNFATFTTLRPNGHPATQVMWIDCDDEFLILNTEKHRKKYSNSLGDSRVTVTMWQYDRPYNYIEVPGLVHDYIEGQAARDHIDQLAMLYFGRPYDPTIITSERVMIRVRPLSDRH